MFPQFSNLQSEFPQVPSQEAGDRAITSFFKFLFKSTNKFEPLELRANFLRDARDKIFLVENLYHYGQGIESDGQTKDFVSNAQFFRFDKTFFMETPFSGTEGLIVI